MRWLVLTGKLINENERYHVVVPELTIVLVRSLLLPEKGDHEEDDHEGDHVPDSDVACHVVSPVTRVATTPFHNSIPNINSCSCITKRTLFLNSSNNFLSLDRINFEIRFHDIPINIVLAGRRRHSPDIVKESRCWCHFK